jgi:hypothetical protein
LDLPTKKLEKFWKFHRFFKLCTSQKLPGKNAQFLPASCTKKKKKNLRVDNFLNLWQNFLELKFFLDRKKTQAKKSSDQLKTKNQIGNEYFFSV